MGPREWNPASKDADSCHLLHLVRQPRLHQSPRIAQILRIYVGNQQKFVGRDGCLILDDAVLRNPQAEQARTYRRQTSHNYSAFEGGHHGSHHRSGHQHSSQPGD